MKYKGFTLIELLAVILILGIIALIAIPIVNKIIFESRQGAFESSVNNVVAAIEDKCQQQTLAGDTITNIYTFSTSGVSTAIDVKGDLPTNGKILVDSSCKTKVSVGNGKFIATKDYDEDTITISKGAQAPDINLPNEDSCFIFNSSTKTITGYNFDNANCDTDVVIPSTINGVPVESIGRSAFMVATSGTKIISLCTDAECNNVYEEIYNSSKDYSIYPNYSWYYSDLSSDSNLHCISDDYTVWTIKSSDYVHTAGDGYAACLFQGNDKGSIITSVVLPDTLKSIQTSAFSSNQLTSINIPNSVTSIGGAAFSYNTSLSDIKFGNGLKTIGSSAFAKCNLSEIVIPSSVTDILSDAFIQNNLSSVVLNSGLVSIGNAAFHTNSLTTVTIPNTVTSIDIMAFSDNLLQTIYNKTGKSFDWQVITERGVAGNCTFTTGTCDGITIAG